MADEHADHGRITTRAVVTGWKPEDLERKNKLEESFIANGWQHGPALEAHVLAWLKEAGVEPVHVAESENTLVDAGRAQILDLLIGANGNTYTNAVAAIGVGDSAAAYAAGQTNLQGLVNITNRIRKAMDASFPSRSGNVVTWRATFGTVDANFIWNEWAIFNNVTDALGTMLNRSVANIGTKTAALSWQLTVTTTLT